MKKNKENEVNKPSFTPSKQKKYLSLKCLPYDKDVKQSKCWNDKDDVFDYGERLD